jgi:hypothetical protein
MSRVSAEKARRERIRGMAGESVPEAQEILAHIHRLVGDILESNYKKSPEKGKKGFLESVFSNTFREL